MLPLKKNKKEPIHLFFADICKMEISAAKVFFLFFFYTPSAFISE